jgi:hypothetical protein
MIEEEGGYEEVTPLKELEGKTMPDSHHKLEIVTKDSTMLIEVETI